MVKAAELIRILMTVLEERRANAEEVFTDIFRKATEMGIKIDVEIKKPRTCGRQTLRSNPQTANNDSEAYYRITGYIPVFDSVITDLKIRFPEDVLNAFKLCELFPENIVKLESRKEITVLTTCLVETFGKVLSTPKNLQHLKLNAELKHWQQKCKFLVSQLPDTAEGVLNCYDKDIYPIIHQLLKILATLPVSNASAERSFLCYKF